LPLVEGSITKWRLLDSMRRFSAPRQAACRRRRISPTVQVHRRGDGSRRVVGVLSCGSVWACPVCAQRICSHRASELQGAIATWQAAGKPVGMLTFTSRHQGFHDLKKMRKGNSAAWRTLLQGRKNYVFRALFHVKHLVRSVEVTHGVNGWHPHQHVLVFGDAPPEPGALEWLKERWCEAVTTALGAEHAPDLAHGVDYCNAPGAAYLQKMGLEIAHSYSKKARVSSSRTPWEIAADAAAGDLESEALWRSYCRAMKGCRQLTWSRGARRFFGLGLRDSDADAEAACEAADVLEADAVAGSLLAEWDGPSWDACARSDPFWVSKVVSVEVWELEGLGCWLRAPRSFFDGIPPPE